MSSLFPIRSDPAPGGRDPRVVDLDGEDADEVFSALSSKTARRIVTALHEEPRTQSDLAEAIDTTVQNVRYHLDKLEDAGLVEVVDTWYSSRGNEMKVYAPSDGALIVSGDRGRASRLKTALSRLVGGVGVLGLASLLVQVLARRFGAPVSPNFGAAGDGAAPRSGDGGPTGGGGADEGNVTGNTREYHDGADAPLEGNETVSEEGVTTARESAGATTTEDAATTTADSTVTTGADSTATTTPDPTTTDGAISGGTRTVTDGGIDVVTTADPATTTTAADAAGAAGGLPPGLVFFLGGVSVLLVLVTVWYWSGG